MFWKRSESMLHLNGQLFLLIEDKIKHLIKTAQLEDCHIPSSRAPFFSQVISGRLRRYDITNKCTVRLRNNFSRIGGRNHPLIYPLRTSVIHHEPYPRELPPSEASTRKTKLRKGKIPKYSRRDSTHGSRVAGVPRHDHWKVDRPANSSLNRFSKDHFGRRGWVGHISVSYRNRWPPLNEEDIH